MAELLPEPVDVRRARQAVILVLCLIAVIPLSGFIQRTLETANASHETATGSMDYAKEALSWAFSSLSGQEDTEAVRQTLPFWFTEELIDEHGSLEVRINPQQTVIGMTFPLEGQLFSRIEQRLQEKGWHAVPSGTQTAGTFVKREGTCQWVMVSTFEIAESEVAVFQVERTQ